MQNCCGADILPARVWYERMIIGTGIDIVEIKRIEKAMRKNGFKEKILSPDEREYCDTVEKVAGRWAVKEAVAKAMPIAITWRDVEVLNHDSGAPYVKLSDTIKQEPNWNLHVSITHEKAYAAAVAILEDNS